MAVTITDHRTIRNEADANTGWTGTTTLGSSNPTPIEDDGRLGANVGVEIFDSYHAAAAVDLSDAVIYCWIFSRLALGTQAATNGGLMVLLSDATPDRIGFKVAGSDRAAFRHDDGPVGWQCPALDTQSLPASPLVRAGAAANLDLANVTQIGTCVNSLSAAPGMDPTYFADIIRYLLVSTNNGCALSIIGGTSGDPGTFTEMAAADRAVGNQQALGIIRQLATGAFGVQGPLRFGNATGTAASWFEASNATVVFEDRGFRTTLYKIFITDNGTGTTTFRLHSCSLIAPTGVGAEFDAATDTDVTDVVLDACRIAGFTNGVKLLAGHTCNDSIISESGQVEANGATMNGTQVLLSTVATDTSALLWNVATDPDGLLDDMIFSKGTNAHHAIEFGLSSPLTMTLNGCVFTGFGADTTTSAALHFKRTTGTITLNITDGSNPTYKSDGATVNIVQSVPLTITVQDAAKNPIQNAQVSIHTESGLTQLMNEDTNASGIATESYNYASPTNIIWKVRKSEVADSPRYKPQSGTAQITASGFSITITLIPNPVL
ncbi:MAG TPA: hypothetical protein VFH61_18835 [Thermoleophilia bacterium]|nr:hypothetical protein [Thermoleophilia bacterium]